MPEEKHIVRQGQRYRALREVPVLCLVSWEFTSVTSHQSIVPAGEVVTILNDTGNMAIAHCLPEDYKKLEKHFVPWVFRAMFWMYRGFYLSIDQRRLVSDFEYLGHKRDLEKPAGSRLEASGV